MATNKKVPLESRRGFLSLFTAATAGLYPAVGTANLERQFRKPRRGFGVNCFDLFYSNIFSQRADRAPKVRLSDLAARGIPFVRFSCGAFWPSEWKMYQTNRAKYFGLLDETVAAAEQLGIALIPSLFWHAPTISDLVAEPVSYWGRDRSATRDFMNQYTTEIIGRYHKSPSIMIWEFGNEFNAYADLPNALQWWPRVDAAMGTPSYRTELDLLKSAHFSSAYSSFARLAKRLDPHRLVSSGSDIPRPNAMNLLHGNWAADTPEGFRKALELLVPSPVDVLSIHLYPNREGKYFSGHEPSQFEDLLNEVGTVARRMDKSVFVGEFGVPRTKNDLHDRQTFSRMVNALITSNVDWAALWVYDFASQDKDWNVRFDNDRAWQLETLMRMNRLLS